MTDALLDALSLSPPQPSLQQTTNSYLTRLTTLSQSSLTTTEPGSLTHESTSIHRSLQALAKRSQPSTTLAADSLAHLDSSISNLKTSSQSLRDDAVPSLASAASKFASKYSGGVEANEILESRRRALRLGEGTERVLNVLELPGLLDAAIASASSSTSTSTQSNANTTGANVTSSASASATASYATALDLYAHIKRLQRLHPQSALIASILKQSQLSMRQMTSSLLSSLRGSGLKLAAAVRLIGLLRRVAPELDAVGGDEGGFAGATSSMQGTASGADAKGHRRKSSTSTAISTEKPAEESTLGLLFLVSRLANLTAQLEALEPLRDLAEQESEVREKPSRAGRKGSKDDRNRTGGTQTERYLKRYVEVFREQSFAAVSMYRGVFPSSLPAPPSENVSTSSKMDRGTPSQDTTSLPSALSTYTNHITSLLLDTLREFLPNITDASARDSLLTQVLYCAGSLGRLGGDFGSMVVIMLEEMEEEAADLESERADGEGGREREQDSKADSQSIPEWVGVVQKHRVQAGRLEALASGVGGGGRNREVTSPG